MGAFFAVAEEEVAAARGELIADEDVWGGQAGAEELRACGFAEVEEASIGRALAGGGDVEKMDDIGMDLCQGDELDIGCAKGGLEAAAVFKDVFSIVAFGEAEIQNLFAARVGNAAGACAEAVDKPGEFC